MYVSRVPSTSLRGGWQWVSMLPPPRPREGCLLKLRREWIFNAAWGRRRYTSFSSPSQQFPSTSRGIWTGRRWRQYSRHACREYCPSPESRGLWWGDPPSAFLSLVKRTLWACPSLHAWRELCRFWGRHARTWRWRPCLQGLRPHHGDRCDALWRGLPSCSRGHGRCQMPCHIHRNVQVSPGALCHIAERGNPSIPAPLTPSHLWWTLSLIDKHPSEWSVPTDGRPPWTRLLGTPPVPSLHPLHAAGGSHHCSNS